MKLTRHAAKRCQQRAIAQAELSFISEFGDEFRQKGDARVSWISKNRKQLLIEAINQVRRGIAEGIIAGPGLKQKKKLLKKLIKHIGCEHSPYFVATADEDKVVTCGYRFKKIRYLYK